AGIRRGHAGFENSNLVSGLGICDECRSKPYFSNPGNARHSGTALVCSGALIGICDNTIRFPYPPFERTLLAIHELTTAIIELIPDHSEYDVQRRVEELEATVGLRKRHLGALVDEFAGHPAGAVRDVARAKIEKLGAEIE